MAKATDYRNTVLTPRTDLPMRADLVGRLEPQLQAEWDRQDLYGQIRKARAGAPKRILHDGPPYATGDLHVGTGLNKVLKDFIVRYWTMCGYDAPYLPGWDCHGLPIEHRVATELADHFKQMAAARIRQRCYDYAMKFMARNREDFRRLGIFGEWARPYLTLHHSYEAGVLDVFAELVEKGFVYRALRPIHWCIHCETALAEAELEYEEAVSPSVYVRFPMVDDVSDLFAAASGESVDVLVWTTTPWTLPANLAIAVHPRFDYALVRFEQGKKLRHVILADGLVEEVASKVGIAGLERLGTVRGEQLQGRRYRHAWIDRVCPMILADYVTLAEGTGCVHTAPGHGAEDYHSGLENNLEPFSPVDNMGRFTEEAGEFVGLQVFEADPRIVDKVRGADLLLHSEHYRHSYPHCWRCQNPVIFRATEQWFIKIDHNGLRKAMLDNLSSIRWVPAWGQTRIRGMIENRPDWCISRQRTWGVPIPGFHCKGCGRTLIDAAVVRHVRDLFAAHGADHWFGLDTAELLPNETKCPACGGGDFEKENDIFDVWFESGASHRSVLKHYEHLRWPCDVYLEGSDQHRGWFQLSLTTAMGAYGQPPFREVITHGFVVDEKSEKMSKSRGNFISVGEAVRHAGAEIFRLWGASINYQNDIPTSYQIIRGVTDEYRRVRNTIRNLLGNLFDFEPSEHRVPPDRLEPIDRWALIRLHRLIRDAREAYEEYAFHRVFRSVHTFCAVDMSAFYIDVLKDHMYCDQADSSRRRSSQTAMHEIVGSLVKLMAPILVHTSEEAWRLIPAARSEAGSVHLARMPEPDSSLFDEESERDWDVLLDVRGDVLRELERLREAGTIRQPLEAHVDLITGDPNLHSLLARHANMLATILIVSEVELHRGADPAAVTGQTLPGLGIKVEPSRHPKCARCWRYLPTVGSDEQYADICERCACVVRGLSQT